MQRNPTPIYPLSDKDKWLIEQKITKTDTCWLWEGWCNPQGYGRMLVQGTRHMAHRLTYHMYKGPIPPQHVVHHKCHNPRCVSPECLEAMHYSDHIELHAKEAETETQSPQQSDPASSA